jgi:hypothetical protein
MYNCPTCGQRWRNGYKCPDCEERASGSSQAPGSASVASRAAKNEIENAINRLKTVAARCRATMRGKEWTRREHDADIISLEVVPALRRAIWVMPNNRGQR